MGRGAWPSAGTGGTLKPKSKDETVPGPYYMLSRGTQPRIGQKANEVLEAGQTPALSDLAVWYGVREIKRALKRRGFGNLPDDGIFGRGVDEMVREFQAKVKLTVDGIVGRNTTKELFMRDVNAASLEEGIATKILCGLVMTESAFDPGAVGSVDERDLGLCQINGTAHPSESREDRFTVQKALPYAARLFATNIEALGNTRDGIAAYNLGLTGARKWIEAGRPDVWGTGSGRPNDYINRILSAC